ncbi:MAG: response regulator [Desulfarculus sp.]|nr:response regulator [Desulfarculus sp.]
MGASGEELRVLVVEQDDDLRHWLGRFLGLSDGFKVVGYLDRDADLKAEVERLTPDLLLLDTHTTSRLPPETLAELRRALPRLYVVLMDLEEGPNYERLAKRGGADGFLCKVRVPESLEKLRAAVIAKARQAAVA